MDSLQTASAAKLRRLALGLLLTALFVSLAFLAKGQERVNRDAPAERKAADAQAPSEKSGFLTSRPAAAQKPLEAVKVGDDIVTAAGQRRRLQLADGSILFVNQQTEAKLTEAGQLTLKTGEVYVEAAPAKAPVVLTPHGEVSGKASHFSVRVDTADTQVLVARGSLQYKGGGDQVLAGQRLSLGKQISYRTNPVCLSQMLDWTRELMLAAESPLVPGSEHAGGALIAVDPKGQEAKLELRKFHVDVFIEDGFQLALAECWDLFKDTPGLQYAARYERARSLHQAGKIEAARKSFRDLYEATLKDNRLPPIDEDFRRCMQSSAADDPWSQLVNRTAAYLIEKKHRPTVVALARQVWRVEDQPLAQNLLATVLAGKVDGDKEAKERLALTLAVIDFLMENGQVPQADELLKKLLAEPKLAERSDLWRLAATLADRRDMPARGIECLEKALDLEFRRRSPGGKDQEVVDLEQVRGDYRKLLHHYQSLADAMVALKLPPPDGFLAKVIRSADRWRALDVDSSAACRLTADVLRRLGESDLGWDYLTTPIGMRPNEAEPWWELAGMLGRKGELKLADRAYQAAFAAEPTNAQILWDRAQNLRQAGEEQAALRLYRQLAEGTWQPRFQGIQTQARSRLKGS